MDRPRNASNERINCKVVLLGKEYGGKTSLLERFLHDSFNSEKPYQSTIGAAFGAKQMTSLENFRVMLGLWDTAGSERYEAMSKIYYRGAKAAVVGYDVTEKSSFVRAKFWITELLENEERCRIYLTGTKLDLAKENQLNREVEYLEAAEFANGIGATAIETSSKTGENIKELFQLIVDDFASDPNNSNLLTEATPSKISAIDLESKSENKKPCCKT